MDARREQILRDIGIDVWRARPVGSGAEEQVALQAPRENMQADRQIEPKTADAPSVRLHFHYVKTENGICLHAEKLAQSHHQFIRDLVGACANLHKRRTADRPAEVSQDRLSQEPGAQGQFFQGEFNWPILDSGGSPERALDTFFAKHEIGKPTDWVLATDEVLAVVEGMLRLDAEIISIRKIDHLASDAASKRELWTRLKRILS